MSREFGPRKDAPELPLAPTILVGGLNSQHRPPETRSRGQVPMSASPSSLLLPGTAAPSVPLRDEGGQEVVLADYWKKQPILLIFVRHLG